MADEALLRLLAAAQEMEHEAKEGARIVRSAVLAIEAVGENQRLQMRGFERAVEKLAQAAGGERDHIGDLASAQSAEPEREPEQLGEAREPAALQVRRRLHEERLEMPRERAQALLEVEEPFAVRRCETQQLASHALAVAPPRQHRAVGHGRLQRGLRGDHAQTLPVELEVADDLGPQHARHIGSGRDPAAGRGNRIDFLGYAAAAQHFAALEHEGTKARTRQVERRYEPVVSAADDHGVVSAMRHAAGTQPTIERSPRCRSRYRRISRLGSSIGA